MDGRVVLRNLSEAAKLGLRRNVEVGSQERSGRSQQERPNRVFEKQLVHPVNGKR
jgi:hypothetical protein